MTSAIQTAIAVTSWISLCVGLGIDLLSFYWESTSALGKHHRSGVLLVPLFFYGLGLACRVPRGGLVFARPYEDFLLFTAGHFVLQVVVPLAVRHLRRPKW